MLIAHMEKDLGAQEDQRDIVHYSQEYCNFMRLRGHGYNSSMTHEIPTTEAQKAYSVTLTSLAISIINNPSFEPILTNLAGLSAGWMREGIISEEQRMEIFRTYERVTQGETTEEFYERYERERASETIT